MAKKIDVKSYLKSRFSYLTFFLEIKNCLLANENETVDKENVCDTS